MTSSMEQSLANIVEAILFVSGEPVDINEMQRNLNVPELDLMRAVDTLQTQYEDQKRGICLKRFGSHVQLATRAEYAPFVEKMLQPVQKQSLSAQRWKHSPSLLTDSRSPAWISKWYAA